jgi:hypothetical protein
MSECLRQRFCLFVYLLGSALEQRGRAALSGPAPGISTEVLAGRGATWGPPFLDVSGAIISPHKSHDWRCFIDFRAAIINIWWELRTDLPTRGPVLVLVGAPLGSAAGWLVGCLKLPALAAPHWPGRGWRPRPLPALPVPRTLASLWLQAVCIHDPQKCCGAGSTPQFKPFFRFSVNTAICAYPLWLGQGGSADRARGGVSRSSSRTRPAWGIFRAWLVFCGACSILLLSC